VKSTVVVDANVILRYLLADHEQQHLSARTAFDEVRGGHQLAFVGEGVVVECVYVLLEVYGVGRAEIADRIDGVVEQGSGRDEVASLAPPVPFLAPP
jgi:predicted nucleic-acid-binding protein